MFGIDDAIVAGTSLITTIVNKIAPDANIEEQGKIQQALLELNNHYSLQLKAIDINLAQIEVNKIEAGSESFFKSGWRPFVGWTCGIGLGYVAVLEPILRFIAQVIFNYSGEFPIIDTNLTLQVLLGLLGFGAFRSYEKTSK